MKLSPDRYRILRDLDVEAVRAEFVRTVGEPMRPDAIEASLHKARIYAGRVFSKEMRERSKQWLIEHGYEVPSTPHQDRDQT